VSVIPFPKRPSTALADASDEKEQAAWESAALEYLRVIVNDRNDGYVCVSVPALNLALARADRAG